MTPEQKWDLVQYRYSNAEKTLHDVDVLIQNGLWNIAVNRLYYACYYAVSALLLNNNINSRTHAGAIKMLGLHFVTTGLITEDAGTFYTKIFTMRHKGDYEDFLDYEKEDAMALIQPARDFIRRIRELLLNTPQ